MKKYSTLIRMTTLAVTAVLVFMFSALGGTVYAYDNSGNRPCVWPYENDTTLSVPYVQDRNHPVRSEYYTAFRGAIIEWNGASTPAFISEDTSQSKHKIAVKNDGMSGPLGKTSWSCRFWLGKRTGTYLYLNSARLDTKSATYKESVASHELGHYIGIRHSSVSPAVMNLGRDRESVYSPQQDDECGVNARYSHSSYSVTCN